jgi:hypothetical protein
VSRKVFVIGPTADRKLAPLCKEVGFEVPVGWSEALAGGWVEFLRAAENAGVIVADVTEDAPDVSFLIGYALARDYKAIVAYGPGRLKLPISTENACYHVKDTAELRSVLDVLVRSPEPEPWGLAKGSR